MKRVCAYVRLSTASQDTGSQLLVIKQSIERTGDVLAEIYSVKVIGMNFVLR